MASSRWCWRRGWRPRSRWWRAPPPPCPFLPGTSGGEGALHPRMPEWPKPSTASWLCFTPTSHKEPMFIICYICSSSVHIWPFSNLFSPMTKNRCTIRTSRQEVVTCLEKPAQPTGGGALLLESGWWGIIAHTRNFQRRWNYNCRRPNVLFSLAFHFKQGRRADYGVFSQKTKIREGNQWSMEKPIRIALATIVGKSYGVCGNESKIKFFSCNFFILRRCLSSWVLKDWPHLEHI